MSGIRYTHKNYQREWWHFLRSYSSLVYWFSQLINFPLVFELANVIPKFLKKSLNNSKSNYRPISILKNLSKVFEKIMYKQIANFMYNYFSKFQCGFRNNYRTRHYLIALIEKYKSAGDSRNSSGTLLTDLE